MSDFQNSSKIVNQFDIYQKWIRTPAVSRIPIVNLCEYVSIERIPQYGDVILGIVEVVSENNLIEVVPSFCLDPGSNQNIIPYIQFKPSFSTRPLSKGDIILGAIGGRYALDYHYAIVPNQIEKELDLLTFGGVIGHVVSQNIRQPKPTRIRLLSYFYDQHSRMVNTRDYHPKVNTSTIQKPIPPITIVTGGSMESGKTTTASHIIKALSVSGHEVLAGKVTGCATFRDPHTLSASGAFGVTDFAAFGFPSTSDISETELVSLFWGTCNLLINHKNADSNSKRHIVIEIADGIAQPESMILLKNIEIINCVSSLIYSASDPSSAYAGIMLLRDWGWNMPIISGPVANSDLGMNEVMSILDDREVKFINSLDERLEALQDTTHLLHNRGIKIK